MDAAYEKELIEARYEPLFSAAASGLANTTALLLRAPGVDVDVVVQGHTVLHIACQGGHVHIARLLIDHGADIHVLHRGASPLDMLACCLRQQQRPDIAEQVAALRLAHERRGNWVRRKDFCLAVRGVKATAGTVPPSIRVLTQRDLLRLVAQFL